MTYPTVIVNGVSVRVDREGRYNLNDLHAAAVIKGEATEQQRPSQFLRSAQVKRFLKALKSKVQKSTLEQIQPLNVIRGGDNPGVWGVELLAIRYAAWINPVFEISVYETFREAVLNGIGNMTRLNRLDLLIANESKEVSESARKMNRWGVGGRKRMLSSTCENIIEQIDPDMVTIMEGKSS
ncbi:KilA-N domain-containing protein [Rouxiella badensis]|uniref:KilA-N domain-containing protein n=1 Tax=Rouxiella badensis TaxID=1646377 RepID=UPI001D14134E|nr:KilA-N domain-containing protein [Rouxiella badensis]MCC3720540.1 KilA-N domain-containing protein [Rouxiella badensis]MCC3730379.1 KilA-N domain-containing protein [Rouxiella badensis]